MTCSAAILLRVTVLLVFTDFTFTGCLKSWRNVLPFNEVHPFLHVLRFFHVREIVTLKGLGLHQEQIQEYKKEVANIWQRKMLLKLKA
ncbi:hypothetical protein FNE77_09030 [Listeria monocytogenes]|nr:hypothetical protein [Listeria monocytogenes]EAV9814210.1 hypothetical protein [Listeria monocytogenes]EAV9815825.1 hypothetical protein [Listeria monocytogenes]EAW7099118.1 hypothetical protein [Listeria monocytogenes]EBD1502702.1 hypothetical protein [Listeria monocytogenes]